MIMIYNYNMKINSFRRSNGKEVASIHQTPERRNVSGRSSISELRPTTYNSYTSESNREISDKYQRCMQMVSQKNEEINKLKQALKQEQSKSQKLKEKLVKCQQLKDKYLKSRNDWRNISQSQNELLVEMKLQRKKP